MTNTIAVSKAAVSLNVLKPDSMSFAHTAASALDPLQEARIVLQSAFEPIVF